MPGKTKYTRKNKTQRARAMNRPENPTRVMPCQILPSYNDLLKQHPEWEGDRELAKQQNKPWLSPDLCLRDPVSAAFLPGSPRAMQPGQQPPISGERPSIQDALRRILRQNPQMVDQIACNLIGLAIDNDQSAISAIKTALDRVDGPIDQNVNLRAQQFKEGIALADRSAPVPLPGLEQAQPSTPALPLSTNRLIEPGTNGSNRDPGDEA